MAKSRILWGLWLVCVLFAYIFTESYAFFFLAVASFILPVTFLFLTWGCLGKLDAVLWAQPACGKGKKGRMGIQLSNKSLLPLDRIVCTVEGSNLLTGQGFRRSVRMAAVPGGESVQDLEIISPCCGMLSFSAVGITVYDLFGLGRFRKKIPAEARMAVQPDTFGVEVEVAYGESMSLDGEEYSMKKSGFDPSETFAIRDYREGDRIRQIHWKLSEKTGDLLVREYGLPIQNTILLLLETGIMAGEEKKEWEDRMDMLAEALFSVSQELTEQQLVYSIGWQNHLEKIFNCVEIGGPEELSDQLIQVLGAEGGEDETSVLAHYLEQHKQCEFAHVILFSPHRIADVGMIQNQAMVTSIICGTEDLGWEEEDGGRLLEASYRTLAEQVAYLEL